MNRREKGRRYPECCRCKIVHVHPRRRLRTYVRGATVTTMAFALLAGCGGSSGKGVATSKNTISVVGYLNLTDSSAGWTLHAPCAGQGGYSDLAVGAPVTVKNETGAIIATGAVVKATAPRTTVCTLVPLVENVPRSKFYSIEVSHRGESTYPDSDVKADGYLHLALTVGS